MAVSFSYQREKKRWRKRGG